MTRILLVDDMPVYREPISIALEARGFEVETAVNGIDALERVQRIAPDVILLDVAMPRMDGISCLAELRRRSYGATIPVILLTAIADRDHVLKAKGLGVSGYMLKSHFSIDELCQRIDDALAQAADTIYVPPPAPPAQPHSDDPPPTSADASPARPPAPPPTVEPPQSHGPSRNLESARRALGKLHLEKSKVELRLKQCSDLRPFSGVVADVIAMAGSPRGDAVQLASLLKKDPILSSRVLHLANSAMSQSGRAKAMDVLDAVKRIGFARVSNLAASVGIFEAVPSDAPNLLSIIRYWQHSFAVASLMERLLTEPDSEETALAYLVGLCHDLTAIVLRIVFPEEYEAIDAAAVDGTADLRALERDVFGVSRGELCGIVLTRLCVPEKITNPIRQYLNSFDNPRSRGGRLARALAIADSYAHGQLLAPHPAAMIEPEIGRAHV